MGSEFKSLPHEEVVVAERLDNRSHCIQSQDRKSGGTMPILCLISLAQSGTSAQGVASTTFMVGLPSPVSLIYTLSHRPAQRFVSGVILDSAELTANNHQVGEYFCIPNNSLIQSFLITMG